MNKGKAQQVYMELFKNLYAVNKLHWDGGWLNYDRQPAAVAPSGFDPNHIALRELQLDADSFFFCSPQLKVSIASAAFQEKSGLTVQRLHGPFRMDSTTLALPGLRLKTPFTDLALSFRMDKNAFSTDLPADSTGAFTAVMRGSIGAHDLRSLASPYLPKNILSVWPRVPLVINGRVGGNLHRLHINNMYLAMPGILRLQTGGFLTNVTVPEALRADMNVNARTGSLAFIKPLLPKSVTATVDIPQGIAFRGHVKMNGQQIASRFAATQGGGSIGGQVALDLRRKAYRASLKARRLPIAHFLKHQPIHPFTGTIAVRGSGTDFLSHHTQMHAVAKVQALGYGAYNLDNIDLTANLAGGHLIAKADCRNRNIQGKLGVDALVSALRIGRSSGSAATLTADLSKVDLQGLHVVEDPVSLSVCGQVDVATDLDKFYQVQGLFSDITVMPGNELIESLASSYSNIGTDDTIVITRSNKRANIYNQGIRNTILDREEALCPGDMLMIVKNKYITNDDPDDSQDSNPKRNPGNNAKETFIANGDRCIVRRVHHFVDLYGFHFADATLRFPDYDGQELQSIVMLDALGSDAPALTREQQDQLYNRVMEDYSDLPLKGDRMRAVRDNPYYNALQIKFAYAVTCHKAQGGQWEHVYIDQGYMTADMLTPDYFHWLYTAVTRARTRLFLVNWPEEQVSS